MIKEAPAGIRAGRAAGLKVLAVATTHGLEELVEAGEDWIVADLSCVSVKNVGKNSLVMLCIRDALFCNYSELI